MKNSIINLVPEEVSRLIKKIYLNFRRFYYAGDNYHCPVCSNSFRKFLPGGFDLDVIKEKDIIGAGRRDNIICPFCQSTDRDRLIHSFLVNKTNIFKQNVKILHVGPEPSLYKLLKKQKNITYVTGTKYSEGIYYHKGISSVDLLKLPFRDGEFDMVICNHVLEHIIDDKRAIAEIYRVLSNKGIGVLQVPISYKIKETYEDFSITEPELMEKYFGQFDHVRIYGIDYVNRLEDAGFEVQTYYPFDNKKALTELKRFALNEKEKLFVAYKNK